jgi:hypothetical protein
MLVGLKVTVPVPVPVPVPESATTWGLFDALSLNCKLAVRAPEACGEKIMFAVQLAETASVVPHVLLKIEKSDGLAPEIITLLIVSTVVPPFVSVTTFCPPADPTATLAQERLVGEAATAAIAAFPLRAHKARATPTSGTRPRNRLGAVG